jgi:hypothetical protein
MTTPTGVQRPWRHLAIRCHPAGGGGGGRSRERAAEMRRVILRMDLGRPDGMNVADEMARDRSGEL